MSDPTGSVVSGLMQSKASKDAAAAQGSAKRQELALLREQFNYQKELNKPFYDAGLPGFKSYASAITGGIDPNTGRTWTPTTSPAFQWEQQQANKGLNRSLRALGRSNSTFGANATSESNRNLAASEYDRQLGRLADLTNIARGGASSLSNASTNYGARGGSALSDLGEIKAGGILGEALGAMNAAQGVGKSWNSNNSMVANLLMSKYGGSMFGGGAGGGSK